MQTCTTIYLNKDSDKYVIQFYMSFCCFRVSHVGVLERQNVDRRRIEQAFFQYALLKVVAWYPDNVLTLNYVSTLENN